MLEKSVLHVLEYFQYFKYPPSIEEIYTFLDTKASYSEYKKTLKTLWQVKKIYIQDDRVAMTHAIFSLYNKRIQISRTHQKAVKDMRWFFRRLPTVCFVGISGSLSMMSSAEDDDIDLFVVAKHNRLWTSRLLLLIFKKVGALLGITYSSKLCLNLFFSEKNLVISPEKHSEYTAHEILQVKTVIDKAHIYDTFIQKNSWILRFCPNVQINTSNGVMHRNPVMLNKSGDIFEEIVAKIQKWWLKKKKISFQEVNGQLWLISEDYGALLEKHLGK